MPIHWCPWQQLERHNRTISIIKYRCTNWRMSIWTSCVHKSFIQRQLRELVNSIEGMNLYCPVNKSTEYVTLGQLVYIYADLFILLFMYNPWGTSESVPIYAARKLMRWEIRINALNNIFQHISGTLNFLADVRSHRANQENATVRADNLQLLALLLVTLISSLSD